MSDVPYGWTHATIEQLAGAQGLTTDGDWIETKDQDPNGDVRLIQLADIGDGEFRDRSERFVTTQTAHRLNCTFLEKEDLLIARMPDPLGRACIFPGVGQPAITAVDVFIWRGSSGGPSARWLMHFVNSRDVRSMMAGQAGGTTRQRIAGGRVKKLEISVPPLPEQRRIVGKIDSLSAKSKRARDHLGHIPRLVEKYKRAILAVAFTQAAATSEPVAFSGAITSTFYGPRFAKGDYISGGVITLRTTDFDDEGNVRPKSPPSVQISERDFAKWGLEDGDLLVTRTGSIGKCAVYSENIGPALPSAYLIRVRLKLERIRPRFALLFLLSADGQQQLGLGITAVTQPNINAGVIERLRLPIPRIEIQDLAIRRIEKAFTWIERLASEASNARKLIHNLDRAVLDKAFGGELVPQDPDDEPASVLLERIRAERQATSATHKQNRSLGTAIKPKRLGRTREVRT
jgi:type I restriction enzyme S subunit